MERCGAIRERNGQAILRHIECFARLTDRQSGKQVRLIGQRLAEQDGIGALVAVLGGDDKLTLLPKRARDKGDVLLILLLGIEYVRDCFGMVGHNDLVIGLIRTIRKLQFTIAQIQIFERYRARLANRESDGIVVARDPIGCHDMDARGAIDGTEIGRDSLIRQLAHRKDARNDAGAPSQSIYIIEHLRHKALQRHAINQNIRQIGIGRQDTTVVDGIGVGSPTLGDNQHLLLITGGLGDDDILPRTRYIDHHRQLGAIIKRQSIVGDGRIEIDRQA